MLSHNPRFEHSTWHLFPYSTLLTAITIVPEVYVAGVIDPYVALRNTVSVSPENTRPRRTEPRKPYL